jgi:hypothetical protein
VQRFREIALFALNAEPKWFEGLFTDLESSLSKGAQLLLLILLAGSFAISNGFMNSKSTASTFSRSTSPAFKAGLYWFQVGAWAASDFGSSDSFGEGVTGASVEIRVLSNQRIVHPDADLAYWVGLDLPNDAFIQVGYDVNPSDNRGQPSWFWEYFPPGTARESSVGFLGKVGSVVGPNATWVKFSLASSGTVWSAYVNGRLVGSIDLKVSNSGGNGPYASAEVVGTRELDNTLGPAEFRNLEYRDSSLKWHQPKAAVALCCYSVGSDKIPFGTRYPYGVAGIVGERNHWLAGSNLPTPNEGDYLWPWYYVTAASPFGKAEGTGWYVQNANVIPKTTEEQDVGATERYVLTGWLITGTSTQAFEFTAKSNMTVTAIYSHQYLVTINSSIGSTYGSGWYDAGTTASFSVSPVSVKIPGLLGDFGVRWKVVGWQGDYSGTGVRGTIKVDSAKRISTIWGTDYSSLVPLGVFIVVLLGTALLAFRKVKRHRRAKSRVSATGEAHCIHCGASIPLDSIYCRECGGRQLDESTSNPPGSG